MAYEIPQQLQHKEKIIFGLTFSQLAWAAFFGLILFAVFQSKYNTITKFTIATIFSTLGILFIFFDIGVWVRRFWNFSRFRSAKIYSLKMLRFIGINRIEKSVVKSHTDVAIIQITPLNFSIRTGDEKDTIIYGFQRFLNGLDFPVQIMVTTHNLNIDTYLDLLAERTSDKELFEDFSEFMKTSITQNQMRNRQFFLVIPKSSDLDIQCEVCMQRLKAIGLKVNRIENRQILNNLRIFFNDLDLERELPKEDKEKKSKKELQHLIAPNFVKDNVTSIVINKKECRIIAAYGYPRMVESGFLDKIISSNDDFDISIHIEPFAIETMMIMLNKELEKQRADLYAEELKKAINPSLEIKYRDTLKVLEELQKGNKKLFNVSLYINCKGKNSDELDLITKKVEAELNSMMIIPTVPHFRQVQGYKSMIPIAKDELKIKRNITTDALSAFFPFTSPFLTLESKGVMLGLNKNKVPLIRDIFGLSNANGVVLATSGSGKSYFTKLLLSRQRLNKTKVIIIDPQAEYIGLTGHCNGQLVTISKDSETVINPLDLMGHDYIEKRLALMDLFKIMFGELTEVQKSILDKAVNKTYNSKGIRTGTENNRKMPVLKDLYKVLQSMDKKASQMEKVTYRALLNRLYMFTDGVFGFLSKESKIDFDNDFVCFNIGDMPKQVKPVVMFLILDYVYMKMKQSKERKLLVIDEAWSLLSKAEDAQYIFEIVKTCRKFNMGLLLITQDVADLLNSKAGGAVLANSSYSLLLRQKPAIIDSVVRTFNLSQMEKEYLLTATQGKGILIMDNEHEELDVVASPKEHEIVTTNPDEIIQNQGKKEKKPDVNIKLDFDKGLFPEKDLDIDEQNSLANEGYKLGKFVAIGENVPQNFYVKENGVEGLDHTFLVQNIRQEILKYTDEIIINITEDADIIFTDKKGKKVALEIETGNNFKKVRNRLLEKFHEAKLKYKKDLYIILTTSNQKRNYQNLKLGIPILGRNDIPKLLQTRLKKRNK